MSIEKITQTIVVDAEHKAEEIKKEAQEKANVLIQNEKERAIAEAKNLLESAQETRKLMGQKLISAKKTQGKKDLLEAKHAKMEEVYEKALLHFSNMDDKAYASLVENLILSHAETGSEELIMDPEFQKKLPATFLVTLNAKAVTKGLKPIMKYAKETENIGPGVILKQGNIFVNCSVAQLIRVQKEQNQNKIYQILFEE